MTVASHGLDLTVREQGAVAEVVGDRHATEHGGVGEDLGDDGRAVDLLEGDGGAHTLEAVHAGVAGTRFARQRAPSKAVWAT